ncbi:hypothetical protein BDW74DRAFT_160151 [Aspergillus multicolor]|uniref:uncharacterized protein n=1 Tax=Aspergillus multicolor TaxID=41759 RepID=UPI003CCD45B5
MSRNVSQVTVMRFDHHYDQRRTLRVSRNLRLRQKKSCHPPETLLHRLSSCNHPNRRAAAVSLSASAFVSVSAIAAGTSADFVAQSQSKLSFSPEDGDIFDTRTSRFQPRPSRAAMHAAQHHKARPKPPFRPQTRQSSNPLQSIPIHSSEKLPGIPLFTVANTLQQQRRHRHRHRPVRS